VIIPSGETDVTNVLGAGEGIGEPSHEARF
jgi:hypothetical protein